MTVRFIPTGTLDVNTDPSRLPGDVVNGIEVSGAMTRCTNLNLDSPGKAVTRKGSSKVNIVAMDQTLPHLIVEMGGNRCTFSGDKIFWNEREIAAVSSATARWSAIKYNAFNVTTQSIFAANGIDRKRIESDAAINGVYDYAYAYMWEALQVSGTIYRFGTNRNNYQCLYDWEEGLDESVDDSINRRYLWFFEGTGAFEWGIEGPEDEPDLSAEITGKAYAYDWESDHTTLLSYQFGVTRNDYQCFYDWEQNIAIADSVTRRFLWMFEQETNYSITSRIGVMYTYCRKSGTALECESNPSPAAYVEARSGIPFTWAAPSDPQVTHVRAYRTLTGGATFYYAGEYEQDLLTAMIVKADTALGPEVAFDHNRPPSGAVVSGPTYNGYCFMLKDNLLYFSKPNQPEYWPIDYYIEVGPPQEPLTGIQIFSGVPYVESEEEIYMIQGSSADTFFPFAMKAKVGGLSHTCMLAVAGHGIAHVDVDGIYQFAANDDQKISEAGFDPIFKGETKGSMPGLNRTSARNCWLLLYDNKLWFGYPGDTATFPDNVIMTNLKTGRATHYQYSQEFGAVTADLTNNRILGVDTVGFVRILDDSTITTDAGSVISWQIESKSYTDQLYKYFPRAAKYDVELGAGATATGSILLADAVIQTHAITESRNTRKRLIDGTNGDRLGIRLAGTGTASIREVEVE